jgi:hypothetical protein
VVRLNADGSLDTTFNEPTLQLSLTGTNQQALAGTVSALGGIGTDRDNVPTTITLNAGAVDSSGRVDLGNLLINYTNAANSATFSLLTGSTGSLTQAVNTSAAGSVDQMWALNSISAHARGGETATGCFTGTNRIASAQPGKRRQRSTPKTFPSSTFPLAPPRGLVLNPIA